MMVQHDTQHYFLFSYSGVSSCLVSIPQYYLIYFPHLTLNFYVLVPPSALALCAAFIVCHCVSSFANNQEL